MEIFRDTAERSRWPGYRQVVFDCDSTLSRIEGIDELQADKGIGGQVRALTEAAMNGKQELAEVYDRRLDLLKPTRDQVAELAARYRENMVADAQCVIDVLQENGIGVYIVSGGLEEPVKRFGQSLGVPTENIRAVPLLYDELSGEWWKRNDPSVTGAQSYYRTGSSSLTRSDGKRQVIGELLAGKSGRSMLVGDGVSDLEAADAVDLFVGYGGVVAREAVKACSPVFVDSHSLLPVLCLALDGDARAALPEAFNDRIRAACAGPVIRFVSDALSNDFFAGLGAPARQS